MVEHTVPEPGLPPAKALWDYPVTQEKGARQATLLLSYAAGDGLEADLHRPDGVKIHPREHPDVKYRDPADAPYAFYLVETPGPGTWTLRVRPSPELPDFPFTVMVFSLNPAIRAGVNLSRRLFPVNTDIPFKAGAAYEYLPPPFKEPPRALVQREVVLGEVDWETVLLQPVAGPVDKPGGNELLPTPVGSGVFSRLARRSLPGAYPLRVDFPYQRGAPVAFCRVVLQHLPVGPLPVGQDVEKG